MAKKTLNDASYKIDAAHIGNVFANNARKEYPTAEEITDPEQIEVQSIPLLEDGGNMNVTQDHENDRGKIVLLTEYRSNSNTN